MIFLSQLITLFDLKTARSTSGHKSIYNAIIAFLEILM